MRVSTLDRCSVSVLIMALTVMFTVGCGSSITTEASPIGQSRWLHSAILLQDGRLLVFGGQETASRASDKAELYDPSSKSWVQTGSMNTQRGEGHAAVALEDGRVLVVGATEGTSAEIYDPSNGTWSPAGNMSNNRRWASATLLKDGRALIAGGEDVQRNDLLTADIYDPDSGQWTSTSDMLEGHSGHRAIALDNGKILLVGQFTSELFDPENNSWSATASTNRQRALGATITRLTDGRILLTGGEFQPKEWLPLPHPIVKVEIYDPNTEVWTLVADMTNSLKHHQAIIMPDGSVLVIGDEAMEQYNTDTDIWTEVGSMQWPRPEGHSATMLLDGTILIVGGRLENEEDGRLSAIQQVEIYDPSATKE